MSETEDRLRHYYEALREADRASVPPFPWTPGRRRPRAGSRAWLALLAVPAVVAVAVALLVSSRPAPPQLPLSEWSSPTAYLLEPL